MNASFLYVNYLSLFGVYITIIAVQSETQKIARPFSLLGYFQQFGQGPLTNIQWP